LTILETLQHYPSLIHNIRNSRPVNLL